MLRSTRLPLAAESCPLIDPVSPVSALDHQPPWLTAVKGAAVAFSCVLIFRLAWRVGAVTVIDGWYWPVAVAIVLGYASADFVSGSVHWFCDTFFSPQTPLVGPVIFRFRNLMMPPLAWLWWSDLPATGRPWALFGSSFLLALSCGVGATNMLHKWAHDPAPPAAARWLQRRGLILSPERHWVHHQDHSRGFCVTSGWMNRLLDPIRFFPRLERCMRSMLPAPMTGSDPGVDHR
ncbi:MAG TPA: fatty acid desaturase CarF family protein [Thermoanaerobaculia bacterium]|nr:fatty acid desaturase CarF family protein [Thermoanaerobaculia bacterium]